MNKNYTRRHNGGTDGINSRSAKLWSFNAFRVTRHAKIVVPKALEGRKASGGLKVQFGTPAVDLMQHSVVPAKIDQKVRHFIVDCVEADAGHRQIHWRRNKRMRIH